METPFPAASLTRQNDDELGHEDDSGVDQHDRQPLFHLYAAHDQRRQHVQSPSPPTPQVRLLRQLHGGRQGRGHDGWAGLRAASHHTPRGRTTARPRHLPISEGIKQVLHIHKGNEFHLSNFLVVPAFMFLGLSCSEKCSLLVYVATLCHLS